MRRNGSPTRMWLLGVALALAPVLYGLRGLIAKETFLPGRGGSLKLTGTNAIILSWAYICIGLFIHAHFFWGEHPKLWRFSDALKFAALLGFLCCFGLVIWKIVSS